MIATLLARRRLWIPAASAVGVVLVIYMALWQHLGETPSPANMLFLKHAAGPVHSASDLGDIYNSTLGFEKIFVVGLPSRTDRRDSMVLAAAGSNMDIEFIDGVNGSEVLDKAIPKSPDHHGRLSDAALGSWRAHINAIQEVVSRNLTSALILEDDADWDIRVRDQLHNFALGIRALTQPLKGSTDAYADPTYPAPGSDASDRVDDIEFDNLPSTVPPISSPYGDSWSLLWPGHCGMRFPFPSSHSTPKARVVQHDDITIPQKTHLHTVSVPYELLDQYADHTRVVHHTQEGICTLGYAVSRRGARHLLRELGLKPPSAAFDVMVRWFCEGSAGRHYHECVAVQPTVFSHYKPVGPKSDESDISQHKGWQESEQTDGIRWSVRLNAEKLADGKTDFVDQWPDIS